jgi:multisubunit Na+/H+ antiporter MnhF subunit
MEIDENETGESRAELGEDISIYIFSTSAGMVGVCLTVIGIFQIGRLQAIGSLADNLLALDAIAFLISCILSYLSLRMRTKTCRRRYALERAADIIFILGLSFAAVVCFLIAYELL